ncbi:hypothetical protein Tco_0232958 [Tanacetum coccineum]
MLADCWRYAAIQRLKRTDIICCCLWSRDELDKVGSELLGSCKTTEVQFHVLVVDMLLRCLVILRMFKPCTEEWSLETLRKELERVLRMFRCSNHKGKELHLKAGDLIRKHDNIVISSSDLCVFMLHFSGCKFLMFFIVSGFYLFGVSVLYLDTFALN